MLRDSCNTTKNTNCPKYRKAISHYNGFKDGSAIVIKESIKHTHETGYKIEEFQDAHMFWFLLLHNKSKNLNI